MPVERRCRHLHRRSPEHESGACFASFAREAEQDDVGRRHCPGEDPVAVHLVLEPASDFRSEVQLEDELERLPRILQSGEPIDIDGYRALCGEHARRADAYRRAKTAAEFPFPGGRTAQRAYLDAVRDLLGPANGWTVVRIAAPEEDLEAAVRDLRAATTRLRV